MRKVLRQCSAISLLPVEHFQRALDLIKLSVRRRDVVVYYLMRHFFQYVDNKWINNDRRRREMCFFNSTDRTNNACESHNKMLQKKMGAHRPNVWAFIEALKIMENNATLDADALGEEGIAPSRPPRCTSVLLDRQLQQLKRNLRYTIYHNRDHAIRSFLNRAAYLNHRVFYNMLPE
ncbi:Ral guanine nucleotide dissociation stimulator-like 2 [Frankliniella fusca]|uniref:Ral guanine nucleotide dissociation stimulator-like 2 n=1 Tax=Frankliniella fusca TaxID=407009 RepID=A0AAE1I3K0_9NEOP|nr:Ral guanine nucleotide dissociation stimulator-like 2 [Frankliniella fusca]